MSEGKRFKKFLHFYGVAHRSRSTWYNLKWRAIVILLVGILIIFVQDYLNAKYALPVLYNGRETLLSEKLFYWFMTGLFAGLISFALLFEGEFILGVRRLHKQMEEGLTKLEGKEKKRGKQ